MLNNTELNIILYYADYLSLKELSIPVTDNCKYYFIHGTPMNSAYIVGLQPFYDIENPYYQQAYMEYMTLKNSLDEDAINSFIENLCYLRVHGCVDAKDMLNCIHQFSYRSERRAAFKRYEKWKRSQVYTHIVLDNDGNAVEEPCTQYVAHYEHCKNPKARIRYIERVSIYQKIQEDNTNTIDNENENKTENV